MITEAWNELNPSIITSGFQTLFRSEERNHVLPVSISDADDTIPLTQPYRRLATHTNLSDNQIVKWATGEEESSRNLITNDDIIDVYIHKEDDENFEMSVNIDNVIKCLSDVMVWAIFIDIG